MKSLIVNLKALVNETDVLAFYKSLFNYFSVLIQKFECPTDEKTSNDFANFYTMISCSDHHLFDHLVHQLVNISSSEFILICQDFSHFFQFILNNNSFKSLFNEDHILFLTATHMFQISCDSCNAANSKTNHSLLNDKIIINKQSLTDIFSLKFIQLESYGHIHLNDCSFKLFELCYKYISLIFNRTDILINDVFLDLVNKMINYSLANTFLMSFIHMLFFMNSNLNISTLPSFFEDIKEKKKEKEKDLFVNTTQLLGKRSIHRSKYAKRSTINDNNTSTQDVNLEQESIVYSPENNENNLIENYEKISPLKQLKIANINSFLSADELNEISKKVPEKNTPKNLSNFESSITTASTSYTDIESTAKFSPVGTGTVPSLLPKNAEAWKISSNDISSKFSISF